jgi:predicted house-cleaning NTP pyrophosphatase (Maf/HAM1 superfamily)
MHLPNQHDFVYLASQSPRRVQLLDQLGVAHKPLLPGADENAEALEVERSGELPLDYVQRVTCASWPRPASGWPSAAAWRPSWWPTPRWRWAGASWASRADPTKPRALRALSGRSHRVLTAVAVSAGAQHFMAVSVSRVHFADLSDRSIRRYVASGEPRGKAGSYAIQGRIAAWIERHRRQLQRRDGPAAARDGQLLARARSGWTCERQRATRLAAMASQDILINWAPQETRVAIIENGAVQELHIERTLERGLVGNVYLGKVVRVLPGMQSAFIDIGLERAAFLHVADLHPHGNGGGRSDPIAPIERQVFEGQTLTVQVIKDAIGTKGARLSTQDRSPGACWSSCRRTTTSASARRSAAPSCANSCARACTRWWASPRTAAAAASSCAPMPRRPATPNWPTTSPTCARPGPPSASAATASPRARCCTRT